MVGLNTKGNSMKKLVINEVFYSLQGEGQYVGLPMVFVRLAGCNLTCPFCDTDHRPKESLELDELLLRIKKEGQKGHFPGSGMAVCFTGGEPTLQLTVKMVDRVAAEGWNLHIETNGTQEVPNPYLFRCITVSPKTMPAFRWEEVLLRRCELKMVWTPNLLAQSAMVQMFNSWGAMPFRRKFIQPCDCNGSSSSPQSLSSQVKEIMEYIKYRPDWALSVQLHKLLNFQ